MQRQRQGQNLSKNGRSVHDVKKDEESCQLEQEKHDKSFDSINIRYLMFNHVKSTIFTKLESGTSQKWCA